MKRVMVPSILLLRTLVSAQSSTAIVPIVTLDTETVTATIAASATTAAPITPVTQPGASPAVSGQFETLTTVDQAGNTYLQVIPFTTVSAAGSEISQPRLFDSYEYRRLCRDRLGIWNRLRLLTYEPHRNPIRHWFCHFERRDGDSTKHYSYRDVHRQQHRRFKHSQWQRRLINLAGSADGID
ncbi:hypothetical protein Tdes44962_MAKER08909 [Teratosphaeria destructans]|uniref:Uncharacterized protein n=1 Tax=Teratosphaeria destructans TaxID=418781 RepID=A0A9W7W3N4_9PEZI|nr:hypothetical protein Tdes44962_MAKER08909 [Teratosphaeria destructans]